jgi:hypothetical protein
VESMISDGTSTEIVTFTAAAWTRLVALGTSSGEPTDVVEVCATELEDSCIEDWGRAVAKPIRPAERRVNLIVRQKAEGNVVMLDAIKEMEIATTL